MKQMMKRTIALLSLVALLATLVCVPTEVFAANAFYGDYTDVSKVYDYGSCPSMQGLAVGSQMMYTVKIGSNDTKAFISMTDKDTGKTTKLYNADAGSYYFTELGHANDMDVWGIDGYSHLFVTSTNEGSNAIIRYKRSGNNLYKVASYSLTYNGAATCATALAVKSVSGGVITFITKLGMNLYTGSVSTSATKANIELTKLCTISKSRVYIKGSYLDLSNFVNQGFGYYQDTLFVPITGDDGQLNRSVIMVYDLRNASGTIYPTEALVFRVTSGAYSALFEIESCDICSGDGKLYFNTNRRKTNSDTNHDGVSYVDSYTFERLPLDAPTSAPKFTLRYNANGGIGSMADTVVTYGVSTRLRANTFTRTGYTFKGWTAYRTAQKQWRYENSDGSQGGWYAEGSQPAGFTKYIYKNSNSVSATTAVADDVVQLYAQWTKNSYTVNFVDDDGTKLSSTTVSHGQVPTPPATPTKASDGTYSYTFAGWSPAVGAVTGNTTYTATYDAVLLEQPTEPEVTDPSVVQGTIAAHLDRANSPDELKEGVPYVISDYKDTWKHYVLTAQVAQKTSGSKTHTGYLLSGTPSVNTSDLWYIKDGKLVYGSANSSKYLLISYDSASQGQVTMGAYNASTAAYIAHYQGDDFAVRGASYFLNRHGGTASDVVATAYSSAGGSYWHFDRVVPAQSVTFEARASKSSFPMGSCLQLDTTLSVGEAATIAWTSSDSAVASVRSDGTVTGLKAGKVTITATLTAVDGHALQAPVHVDIPLTIEASAGLASTVQHAVAEPVSTLQTGVPYVITEKASGAALTGTMVYTTSSDYQGLNGIQGLKTIPTVDLNNAPVWYYDGTRLLYGTPVGSNNYLVYNASNQVALGTLSSGKIFDQISAYSSSDKTFNISTSAITSGNRYVNQMGGSRYNAAGLYSSAYYSRWTFSRLSPQRTVTLSIAPNNVSIMEGLTTALTAEITSNGISTGSHNLIWTSSNTAVATVSASGVITAKSAGTATVTATVSTVDGRALDQALTVQIKVQVTADPGCTATAKQDAKLVKVSSLKTNTPYVITEKNTGAALTGTVTYTTDSDYRGLNNTQGLKLISNVTAANAPLWYYDGTHLLYGTAKGSNNYLVYNSSNQVALGSANETNIFDVVSLYSSSNKSFLIYPSAKTSGSVKYYLNQYGGGCYNAAGVYTGASTSQWHFSELIPAKTVSLNVKPGISQLSAGKSVTLNTTATVDGTVVTDYSVSFASSNTSVVTVNNGVLTAVAKGSAVITVTLTAAEGDAFTTPVTVEIPITVS